MYSTKIFYFENLDLCGLSPPHVQWSISSCAILKTLYVQYIYIFLWFINTQY